MEKSGLKRQAYGYARTVKRARGNVVLCGDSGLTCAAALCLAGKRPSLNVFVVRDLVEAFPALPSLVIEISGDGDDAALSAGSPISGYTRLKLESSAEDASAVKERLESLRFRNVKLTAYNSGDALVIEAYHFNDDELEEFVMELARITAPLACRVTAEAAFPPLAQSNAILSRLFPVVGTARSMETEFKLKPYHAAFCGECAVIKLGGGEGTVRVLTDMISLLTEER